MPGTSKKFRPDPLAGKASNRCRNAIIARSPGGTMLRPTRASVPSMTLRSAWPRQTE
jgi:hypothetical protein